MPTSGFRPHHLPIIIERIEVPDDIDEEVIRAATELSKELHFTNHMQITRQSLERILENPGCYWLAGRTIEGRIIGMVVLHTYWVLTNGRSLIDNLVIEPSYRRKGVGTTLVREAIEICRDLGINKARANTAIESHAAKLMEKAGFTHNPMRGYHLLVRGDE